MHPTRDISDLIKIMRALRTPETGCPWDLEQTFDSIKQYTIEEAYEVADAIERKDYDDLKSELGDLLFQPVFYAQIAQDQGLFDFGDIVYAVSEKMIRRHPHVFMNVEVDGVDHSQHNWENIKASERAQKSKKTDKASSILDDVPNTLPALTRASKLAKRAARVGFDWPNTSEVIAKIREELTEVEEALETDDIAHHNEEIGDLLFAISNLARKANIDPEMALRDANAKFIRRFKYVEKRCTENNENPSETGLQTLDSYWNEIRAQDKLDK